VETVLPLGWKNALGVALPDGAYTIAVQAKGTDGSAMTVATDIYGKVDGIDLSGSTPSLKIGGVSIDINTVQSIDSKPAQSTVPVV